MSHHWFEEIAEHLGSAYLRYSFTKGTENEVGFLVDVLGLRPGDRVLDVGCGPGRHSRALAALGIDAVGLDVSAAFLERAGEGRWIRGDARRLPVADGSFDAAVSLCQGGFGLVPGEDHLVVAEVARALKPGGRLALSAFSAYFAVKHLDGEGGSTFDAATGTNHERTTVKDEQGRDAEFDLWTSCFTPRELRQLCALSGLEVDDVYGVTPGGYARNPPSTEVPEHLVVARRPDR